MDAGRFAGLFKLTGLNAATLSASGVHTKTNPCRNVEIFHSYTYSHIKNGKAAKDGFWRKVEKRLGRQYPAGGAGSSGKRHSAQQPDLTN